MPPLDTSQFHGMNISNVVQRAQETAETGKATLLEAKAIYEACLKQKLEPYTRGRIRQDIWHIDRCLGDYPLYLSQGGQDRYVHETFFKNKRDGVFVEIGGCNGWVGSNCYFFEKTLGWTGVIVEASPALAKQIGGIRDNPVVHAAIADRDDTMAFREVAKGFTQMGGLVDYYSADALEMVRSHPNHVERTTMVSTLRLETLLQTHGLDRVDYCSIDVEGAERAILSDFDFGAYDISVLSVENGPGNTASSVRDIMEPAGYQLVDIVGPDEIYKK